MVAFLFGLLRAGASEPGPWPSGLPNGGFGSKSLTSKARMLDIVLNDKGARVGTATITDEPEK